MDLAVTSAPDGYALLANTPKVMCVANARPWHTVQEVITPVVIDLPPTRSTCSPTTWRPDHDGIRGEFSLRRGSRHGGTPAHIRAE